MFFRRKHEEEPVDNGESPLVQVAPGKRQEIPPGANKNLVNRRFMGAPKELDGRELFYIFYSVTDREERELMGVPLVPNSALQLKLGKKYMEYGGVILHCRTEELPKAYAEMERLFSQWPFQSAEGPAQTPEKYQYLAKLGLKSEGTSREILIHHWCPIDPAGNDVTPGLRENVRKVTFTEVDRAEKIAEFVAPMASRVPREGIPDIREVALNGATRLNGDHQIVDPTQMTAKR